MILKKIYFFLALIFFLLVSDNVYAESTLDTILKRGEIRIGVDESFMPFTMVNKKGELIGFDIDLGNELAHAMNVKFVPVIINFEEIIPALLNKEIDIIFAGTSITGKRNLKINFVGQYHFSGQSFLLSKRHQKDIHSFKDLNDTRYLVVSRASTTGEAAIKNFLPKARFQAFKKEENAYRAVADGRADAYVSDLLTLSLFKQQIEGEVILFNKPFTYERLGFGIRPNDIDFENWLANFLLQIQKDGRLEKLVQKWMQNSSWIQEIQ